MEISLPNIHYFNIDMSKMGLINKEEVRTLKIFKAHLISSPLPLQTWDNNITNQNSSELEPLLLEYY